MHDLLCQQRPVQADELVVVDEQQYDVGGTDCFVHFRYWRSDVFARLGVG